MYDPGYRIMAFTLVPLEPEEKMALVDTGSSPAHLLISWIRNDDGTITVETRPGIFTIPACAAPAAPPPG